MGGTEFPFRPWTLVWIWMITLAIDCPANEGSEAAEPANSSEFEFKHKEPPVLPPAVVIDSTEYILPREGRSIIVERISPPGIGSEAGVHFGITRRRQGARWIQEAVNGWVVGPAIEFPANPDEPNDDTGDDDEDRSPTANLIYSLDNPARPTIQPPFPSIRIVKRGNMNEFVRVKIGKSPIQSNNQWAGSRSSPFVPWHFRCDISRDTQDNWDFTQGQENVVASVNPPLGDQP